MSSIAALLDDFIVALGGEGVADEDRIARLARFLAAGGTVDALREAWPHDRPPIVGRYICIARIGQGASGTVYKAVSADSPGRIVALKILRPAAEDDRQRFLREIQILRRLDCPHVVRHFDSGTAAGFQYLAMDYVAGKPLDEHLRGDALAFDDKLELFEKVCRAVESIHQAGVIHRDLKPKHVIVNTAGEPTIVDFGLSAARGANWSSDVRRTQTELGQVVGTLLYMSPEQAWGGIYTIDQRTDIWSLGVMLYEIVTGGDYPFAREPVNGLSAQDALLRRIQTDAPKRPVIKAGVYAPGLTTLVSRCLVYEPDRRVASAGMLADDLARIRAQRAILTRPLPLRYRLRRLAIGMAVHARFALSAAAVFAVVLVLAAVAWMRSARWNAEDDFSKETRELLAAATPAGGMDFVILSIGDDSLSAVPAYASTAGIAGVTRDVRTWRGLHGLLMERMAAARPRLLVWDLYFASPRAEDAAFVKGAKLLRDTGAGLALAAKDVSAGDVQLSPGIWEPLRASAVSGIILARDMVERPGEFVLALQRDDHTYSSLMLAAFAALVHPACRPDIDYATRRNHILVRYRPMASGGFLSGVDEITLSRHYVQREPARSTAKTGDVLACKAFPLTTPGYWQERTVAYEQALRATPDELRELVAGRIVIVTLTVTSKTSRDVDRHDARYPEGVIKDVPGGYLLADGLRQLLRGVWSQAAFPNTALFSIMLFTSVAGCFAGIPLARRAWPSRVGAQWALVGVLLAAGGVCAAYMVALRTENSVQFMAGSAAAASAAALSLAIESVRQRHRLPATDAASWSAGATTP